MNPARSSSNNKNKSKNVVLYHTMAALPQLDDLIVRFTY